MRPRIYLAGQHRTRLSSKPLCLALSSESVGRCEHLIDPMLNAARVWSIETFHCVIPNARGSGATQLQGQQSRDLWNTQVIEFELLLLQDGVDL